MMDRSPDFEVQSIIHMGSLCSLYRCLPDPGGLFDQDSYKIWLLTLYNEAVAERREREEKAAEARARQQKR